MPKTLRLVNGLPKIVEISGSVSYYDASILVTTPIGQSGPGYNAGHTRFYLPNNKTYDGTTNQLEVFCNEASWENGVHYAQVNSTDANYIDTYEPIPQGSRIRFRIIG